MTRGGPAAAAALLLTCAAAAAGAALATGAPTLHGAVYDKDSDHPLPGALVVLYDAGELMEELTYTRDDGGFRLPAPQSRGRFSLVATTPGGRSRRAVLDFDPAGGSRSVTFVFPAEEGDGFLPRLGKSLLDTLDGIAGTLVGLIVGYLFHSRVEERAAARARRRLFLSDLRAAAETALQKYPIRTPPYPRPDQVAPDVQRIRQVLERHAEVQDALHRLAGEKGRQSYRALAAKVGTIEKSLDNATGLGTSGQDVAVEKAREELRTIRDRPLG